MGNAYAQLGAALGRASHNGVLGHLVSQVHSLLAMATPMWRAHMHLPSRDPSHWELIRTVIDGERIVRPVARQKLKSFDAQWLKMTQAVLESESAACEPSP